jgi:hypothetical protein
MEFNGNYFALYLSVGLIVTGVILLIAEQIWYSERKPRVGNRGADKED